MEEVRTVLWSLTQDALGFAQGLVAQQGSYAWMTHADLEFDAHDQSIVVQRFRPDMRLVAIGASRELLRSPKLPALIEAVSASPAWNARFFYDPTGSASREWQLDYAVLQPFVLRYAELAPDLGWAPEIFGQVWPELSGYAETGEARVVTVSVLHNLDLEEDLDLDDAGQLQRLTPAAKQHLWRDVRSRAPLLFSQAYLQTPQGWAAQLRTELTWRDGDHSAAQQVRERHEQVLKALRLVGPGRVAMSVTYSVPAGPGASFALGARFEDLLGPGDPPWGQTSHVSADDGPRLRSLLAACTANADQPDLAFAFRRFAMSYERELADDQLVDGWIALEALFGDPEEREGVADRLADGISRELESDERKRKKLRSKVLSYYDIRSRLVHGNRDLSGGTIAKVARRTDELLRGALVRRIGGVQ